MNALLQQRFAALVSQMAAPLVRRKWSADARLIMEKLVNSDRGKEGMMSDEKCVANESLLD
jgi:hypothetical protein